MTARGFVYIAASVDGFIAREDDGLDWLEAPEPGGEDYGYAEFVAGIDALLLGRRTYEVVRAMPSWPYGERRVIVASRTLPARPAGGPDAPEVAGEALPALFARLAGEGVRSVYVDGGKLITAALAAGLIDEVTITRIPILLGRGIPLFGTLPGEARLEHLRTRAFPNGFVQSTYRVGA